MLALLCPHRADRESSRPSPTSRHIETRAQRPTSATNNARNGTCHQHRTQRGTRTGQSACRRHDAPTRATSTAQPRRATTQAASSRSRNQTGWPTRPRRVPPARHPRTSLNWLEPAKEPATSTAPAVCLQYSVPDSHKPGGTQMKAWAASLMPSAPLC